MQRTSGYQVLNKIYGIYLCILGNILIFGRNYLGELKKISKFRKFNLFKVASYEYSPFLT